MLHMGKHEEIFVAWMGIQILHGVDDVEGSALLYIFDSLSYVFD